MDFTLEKNISCTYMRINDIGGNNRGNNIFFVCFTMCIRVLRKNYEHLIKYYDTFLHVTCLNVYTKTLKTLSFRITYYLKLLDQTQKPFFIHFYLHQYLDFQNNLYTLTLSEQRN